MPYGYTDLGPDPMVVGSPVVVDGDFGSDEGNVFVGATPATVTAWGPAQITFTCPDVGAGDFDVHIDCVNHYAVGVPTVSGEATEGVTLTSSVAGISDPDGIVSYAYQWQRGVADISGATSSTYLIDAADVGSTLRLEVTVTDDNGIVEDPLYSADTAVVQAAGGANEYQWLFRTDMGVFPTAGHRASTGTTYDWRGYGLITPADTPRMVGARWTGSAWTNTEDDDSTVLPEWRRGILLEPVATNQCIRDFGAAGDWNQNFGNNPPIPTNDYAYGDVSGNSFQITTTENAFAGNRGSHVGKQAGLRHYTHILHAADHQNVLVGLDGNNINNGLMMNVDTSAVAVNSTGEGSYITQAFYASVYPIVQDGSIMVIAQGMELNSSSNTEPMASPKDTITSAGGYDKCDLVAGQIALRLAAITSEFDSTVHTSPISSSAGSTVTRAADAMTGDITSMAPIDGALQGNDHCGQVVFHGCGPLVAVPVGATIMELSDAGGGATYGLRIYKSAENTFRLDSRAGYHEIALAALGDYYTLDFRWSIRPGSSNFWINGQSPTASGGVPIDPAATFARMTLGNADSGSPSGTRFPGIYDQYRLVDSGLSDGEVLAW